MINRWVQRGIVAGATAGAGWISLPLAASVLDGQGTENWIFPAQAAATVGVGAGLGAAMPAVARAAKGVPNTSRAWGAAAGAGIGVLGLAMADTVWFGQLAGFRATALADGSAHRQLAATASLTRDVVTDLPHAALAGDGSI
jgi:hypothetical protein